MIYKQLKKYVLPNENDRKKESKHPKFAVLPLHKKTLYDWLHIRVLCYLQFMGSSLINSSSSMSSKGFANTCLNHMLGSIFASLQHAMNV